MKTFEFLLILEGVDISDECMANALYEAGCDDGTLFSSSGEVGIGFSREASSLEEAVRSAIADVRRAGITLSRAEPADALDAQVIEQINQELAVQYLTVGQILNRSDQQAIDIWRRGQTNPLGIPDAVLFTRLAEAVAWCCQLFEDKKIKPLMRSSGICPRILHDGRDDVVCEVGSHRQWQIKVRTVTPVSSMPNLNGGRLVCYFPDANLCDGAAEFETGGFFDVHNTPPWDTWIGYFQDGLNSNNRGYDNYLLAYVPTQLVSLAEAGIRVNPEECISWLEDTDVKLRSRLLRQS